MLTKTTTNLLENAHNVIELQMIKTEFEKIIIGEMVCCNEIFYAIVRLDDELLFRDLEMNAYYYNLYLNENNFSGKLSNITRRWINKKCFDD